MAKKKKTQLKPVARGFATTSQPKKVVPPPEEPEAIPEANVVDTEPAATDSAGATTPVVPQDPVDEFDPEKVEEQSLQNLVDKLQEKTEKDIVRTVKVRPFGDHRRLQCSLTPAFRPSKSTDVIPKLSLPWIWTARSLTIFCNYRQKLTMPMTVSTHFLSRCHSSCRTECMT